MTDKRMRIIKAGLLEMMANMKARKPLAPEASALMRQTADAISPLFRSDVQAVYDSLDAPPAFDESTERQEFEDRTYAFYLQQREKRAAAGKPIANDTEQPTARELMFARNPVNGDYLVWAYQAAWSGWRMARGGA